MSDMIAFPAEKMDAYWQLYATRHQWVIKQFERRGFPTQVAEELADVVFDRVLKYFSSFDSTRPFDPWVKAIVARVAADWYREKNIFADLASRRREAILLTHSSIVELSIIEQLIDSLPDGERKVLRKRIEDERAGRNNAGFAVTLCRARKRLREWLRPGTTKVPRNSSGKV